MSSECVSCRKSNVVLVCQVCEGDLCKKCAQILNKDLFLLAAKTLEKTTYCGSCFDKEIAPELEVYEQTAESAKQVFIFFKTQKNRLPVIKRAKEKVSIASCHDRELLTMMLAYQAAKVGFNAVIETELTQIKVRKGAYQTSDWKGEGVPAQVDQIRLERHLKD